jgi:hypothetical protein
LPRQSEGDPAPHTTQGCELIDLGEISHPDRRARIGPAISADLPQGRLQPGDNEAIGADAKWSLSKADRQLDAAAGQLPAGQLRVLYMVSAARRIMWKGELIPGPPRRPLHGVLGQSPLRTPRPSFG